MATKRRVHYPGAVYHVVLRGNGGQDIFLMMRIVFIFENCQGDSLPLECCYPENRGSSRSLMASPNMLRE